MGFYFISDLEEKTANIQYSRSGVTASISVSGLTPHMKVTAELVRNCHCPLETPRVKEAGTGGETTAWMRLVTGRWYDDFSNKVLWEPSYIHSTNVDRVSEAEASERNSHTVSPRDVEQNRQL